MQLTRAADYAVRVMITLAAKPPGTRASHTELADAVDCPRPFLAKVLQRLTRAGLILSHRGNVGGYELKKSRRSATVLQVVEAVEGPLLLNVCTGKRRNCRLQDACTAQSYWERSQAAVVQVLNSARVDELAAKTTVTAAPPKPSPAE
jgi:Rrf2 family protein